ncbi:MAG: hypothetical protein ACK57V_00235, partial [Pirellula sp.]
MRWQKKRRLTSDTYQFSGLAYSKRKRAALRVAEVAIDNDFSSKSSELGRKPLEIESPMRLQAPHLTHRLSLPGYLAEHPSKVFRQS